jgi:hypothetical protein
LEGVEAVAETRVALVAGAELVLETLFADADGVEVALVEVTVIVVVVARTVVDKIVVVDRTVDLADDLGVVLAEEVLGATFNLYIWRRLAPPQSWSRFPLQAIVQPDEVNTLPASTLLPQKPDP